jgi:hypothetical protein
MSDEIESALTPEQWADVSDLSWWAAALARSSEDPDINSVPSRHHLAALCLHRQPFGFTQEDVMMLEDLAVALPDTYSIASLADRIAALLPPEAAKE